MNRRKKSKQEPGIPAWMLTFSDLMTLLLTFFVLLVSMAVIDEQRKLVVLGSIVGTFGASPETENYLAQRDERKTREIGPMNDIQDLELLKPLLYEDARDDIRFAENKLIQIMSISSDILFEPGQTKLSERGRDLVGRMAPVLRELPQPFLLAGHTSTLRDELKTEYLDYKPKDGEPNPGWRISLGRAMAMYRELLVHGVPAERMRVEAFADYRQRFGNETAAERRMNRRVDIVLDKRGAPDSGKIRATQPQEKPKDYMDYQGFRFGYERQSEPAGTVRPEQE
ncbi:OmpA/MotB family protein [Desulfocurvibacter africanus]|nr:flagellar motor protein MotB [Desulfocurvibacter africanus]